tara:strand:+ start:310 stop:588 length:279 start_codon:yes stop_codon:yes gene_type:complete
MDNDIKKLDKNILFSKRYKNEKIKNKIINISPCKFPVVSIIIIGFKKYHPVNIGFLPNFINRLLIPKKRKISDIRYIILIVIIGFIISPLLK